MTDNETTFVRTRPALHEGKANFVLEATLLTLRSLVWASTKTYGEVVKSNLGNSDVETGNTFNIN